MLSAAGITSSLAIPAAAQVTLYGIVDVGVTRVSNQGGDSVIKLSSGELQQSRFGFRGTEDLGGGYSAFFNLENGFTADTGALASANVLFSREARVGLKTPGGTVALGRQAASHVDFLGKYTASMLVYGPGYYATHPGNHDRLLNVSVDNSIKYQSPSLAGLSVGASYGFGEQPGSTSRLGTWSVAVGYDKGPFSMGVGYFRSNGPLGVTTSLAPAANPFSTAAATSPDDALDSYGVGSSYAFAPSSLIYGLITQAKFKNAGTKAQTLELGLKWSPSTVWTLGADVSRTEVKDRDARMNIVSLSAAYSLSKRTDIYGIAAAERVSGSNAAGGALTAQMFSQGASTGSSQNVLRLALRHKF